MVVHTMDWLNYHHLLYFWTVAREGGISRAAEKLRLSQPTISAQVRLLEESLGHRLFQRQGRTLVLTDVGRIVYGYDMYVDQKKISVSLATLQFEAVNGGTRLVITEQGAFLDGYDDAGGREQGTRMLVENLAVYLEGRGEKQWCS